MTLAKQFGGWTLWSLMTLGAVGIALISYRYIPHVGPMPPLVLANLFAKPWLIIHVTAAASALLVGSFQFVGAIRRRWPKIHRWSGRTYVMACLLGGASGFILAWGSFAGPVATAGFGTLALIWIGVTWQGWQTAMQRRFAEHRGWMIRSWALTFAAVNLRLYLPWPEQFGFDFVDGYRFISFACWVPNLAVAELYLRWEQRRHTVAAVAQG